MVAGYDEKHVGEGRETKGEEHFGGLERGCRISGGSLTRDWLCRSELMKRPTPVESSEILNFWNFAVRRVYMPTGLPPTHPRFSAPRVHVPRLRKFFRRISPIRPRLDTSVSAPNDTFRPRALQAYLVALLTAFPRLIAQNDIVYSRR